MEDGNLPQSREPRRCVLLVHDEDGGEVLGECAAELVDDPALEEDAVRQHVGEDEPDAAPRAYCDGRHRALTEHLCRGRRLRQHLATVPEEQGVSAWYTRPGLAAAEAL
jgi:hypothetical protein